MRKRRFGEDGLLDLATELQEYGEARITYAQGLYSVKVAQHIFQTAADTFGASVETHKDRRKKDFVGVVSRSGE